MCYRGCFLRTFKNSSSNLTYKKRKLFKTKPRDTYIGESKNRQNTKKTFKTFKTKDFQRTFRICRTFDIFLIMRNQITDIKIFVFTRKKTEIHKH